jgi:Lactonase, 7-bladed beta-propeller
MKKFLESRFLRLIILVSGIFATSHLALAQTQYVLTNDDLAFPFLTGVGFFTIGANGLPVFQEQVHTGTFGIGGGYFGMNRLAVLDSGTQQCVFASEALNAFIVGVDVSTLTVGGITSGSDTDAGTTNGIGMVMNGNYLYASFSDSNTIGTFAVQPGCSLTFIGDTSVIGLHGGVINGTALHGAMLITSYTDGSIESFTISGGTPISNGDEQLSTATVTSQDATYANAIDITKDGHYAIFGDTSTALSVEVSDISSGKLTKTTIYKSTASISSSNILLSPDETILYVVNTQGATISALFFDKNAGKLSAGCTSGPLAGLSQNWSYLAGAVLMSQSGNGGGVYVAEFGTVSGIATVPLSFSGQKCSLREAKGSPTADPNTPGLLSIGSFPPRSF